MMGTIDITGTTQSVVVGQQIPLTASYTLPAGYTFTSQSWTIPGTGSTPPTAIANFTYAPDFSIGGPVPLTPTQLVQQSVTFYWVTPTIAASPNTVTFQLNYVDNQGNKLSTPVTARFSVAGPTSVSAAKPVVGQWQIQVSTSGPRLYFGFPIGEQGIAINASATSPSGHSGTYEWAQLITLDTAMQTLGSTTTGSSAGTGLDNQFPAETGLSFTDSPSLGLQSQYSEVTWSLGFTTYLMWRPGLTNDIPVPLGYVTWSGFGDASQNGGTWMTNQTNSTTSSCLFQLSASYPVWTSKVVNSSSQSN